MRLALLPTPDLACPTGSTTHATELAAAVADLGHQVHVLCSTRPVGSPPGVSFHLLPLPLEHPVFVDRPVPSSAIAACVALLVNELEALAAGPGLDVIHAHYAAFTGLAGVVASSIYDVPVVVSTFGRDLLHGAGRDARYRRIARVAVSHADALIAATPGLRAELVQHFGGSPDRITVLPMGINADIFREDRTRPAGRHTGDEANVVVLVIASAFGPEKGLDVLLRALALVPARDAVTLRVVGEDDEPGRTNERRLHALAEELRLDKVSFFGRVAHAAMPMHIEAADVVVDPRLSGHHSSSLLEALAMGKPVVCSSVADAWGLVEPGLTGYRCPPGDPQALAQAIDRLVGDPGRRVAFAAGARKRAPAIRDRFAMTTVARKTVDLYEALVAARAGGPAVCSPHAR